VGSVRSHIIIFKDTAPDETPLLTEDVDKEAGLGQTQGKRRLMCIFAFLVKWFCNLHVLNKSMTKFRTSKRFSFQADFINAFAICLFYHVCYTLVLLLYLTKLFPQLYSLDSTSRKNRSGDGFVVELIKKVKEGKRVSNHIFHC